jgi:hypothetical protein
MYGNGEVFWRLAPHSLTIDTNCPSTGCCNSGERKLSTRRWERLKSYVSNIVQIAEILYLLVFVGVQSGVAQDGMFLELPPDVGILVSSPRIFDRFQPLLFGERGLLRRYGELSRELDRHELYPAGSVCVT